MTLSRSISTNSLPGACGYNRNCELEELDAKVSSILELLEKQNGGA